MTDDLMCPAHPDQAAVNCACPAADAARADAADKDAAAHRLLAGLRTGDWLDAQDFPPTEWAVPGLIPEGASLLVGGPKLGKSWMVLGIALAVASGGVALGRVPVDKRPVLYLALEDGDKRLQGRCRDLLNADPIPPGFNYLTRVPLGMAEATIEAWLDYRARDAKPLIILDTLGKVMPPSLPGESAYARDYRVSGRLKSICDGRPGSALVVVHHDRKAASEDFVEAASGTNGIAGAMDTIIVLARKRHETTGLLKVTGRDVDENEYAVTTSSGTWTIDGDTLDAAADAAATARVTDNLGDRSADIVRLAADRPDGIRAADVADYLGISADQARRYLRRLYDTGRLNSPGRGLYTRVTSVTSVTFDGDDHTERDSRDVSDTCPQCDEPMDDHLPGCTWEGR